MTTSAKERSAAVGKDASMLEMVDELVRRHQAGEPIDLEELAGGDPARVEQLRQLLPTLEKLADLGLSVTPGLSASPPAADDQGPGPARWATTGIPAEPARQRQAGLQGIVIGHGILGRWSRMFRTPRGSPPQLDSIQACNGPA